MPNYKIIRPPLAKTFELPTKNELLKLKPGDSVKLIFSVGGEDNERMWVILKDCSQTDEWRASIDNDAIGKETRNVLPVGKEISFHPLDIIQLSDKKRFFWF